MAKSDSTAAANAAVAATAATAEPQVCELYFTKSATLGAHHFAATAEGAPPTVLDFANLPTGITAADIDFLVTSGGAEPKALREARAKR